MLTKVLVANRGEIALRVVRSCAELGLASVAVHSPADAAAPFVAAADEAVELPGGTAEETYLNADAVVAAAVRTGANAVHPGYGFLAENAAFARAVVAAGLVFVGPPADTIEVMGEKTAARRTALAAGVPLVPGTTEPVTTAEQVTAFGAEHGYPVAVKAAHGGGGRGMRVVHDAASAGEALDAARREAGASFGADKVYLERYLSAARHVEVQVLADAHGTTVPLGDRDCSVQRRHQKLVEEAPAPGLSDALRKDMGDAATRLARAVGYVGAGTVEFLVDDDLFYFLEMNTRIQVEHPVTEAVFGVDLVQQQLEIAAGRPLPLSYADAEPRGHAIECRVNAEDVTAGRFLPAPGVITRLHVPSRPGVRFDGGYAAGDEVSALYDSMIGKLVVWAQDRPTAIRRTLAALRELVVDGVPTTVPAALAVVGHADFAAGDVTTRWLEQHLDIMPADEPETVAANEVWVGGRRYAVPFHGTARPASAGGRRTGVRPASRRRTGDATAPADGSVVSPMLGTVIAVAVAAGDTVTAGQTMFVIEAMKMENPVPAPVPGVVAELTAVVGAGVTAGERLAVVERSGDD